MERMTNRMNGSVPPSPSKAATMLVFASTALGGCFGPEVVPCTAPEAGREWTELTGESLPIGIKKQLPNDGNLSPRATAFVDDQGNYHVCYQDPYCSPEIYTFRKANDTWSQSLARPVYCE